jgi:hypothetical protein
MPAMVHAIASPLTARGPNSLAVVIVAQGPNRFVSIVTW